MKKNQLSLAVTSLVAALALNACTNATTTTGTASSYVDATIVDVELVDIEDNHYDNTRNTLLGAIIGAGAGYLIGDSSTGTAVGAAIGGVGANLASQYGNRQEGMRILLDSDYGNTVLDRPFSCAFKPGAKVRLLNHSGGGELQVKYNGKYLTPERDSTDKCPNFYASLKQAADQSSADYDALVSPDYGSDGQTSTISNANGYDADYDNNENTSNNSAAGAFYDADYD